MKRASITTHGGDSKIVLTAHDKGHFSIQETFQGLPRPPIVLNAKRAYAIGQWLVEQAGEVPGKKAEYDPVEDAKANDKRRR